MDAQRDPMLEFVSGLPEIKIMAEKTALMCIDLQYYDASADYGVFAGTREKNRYYFERLEQIVLPNVKRLQETFRRKKMEVIHFHIVAFKEDGRDRGRRHKLRSMFCSRNSKEADFLKEVEPIDDEIVMSKSGSGIFTSTNIDQILRNLGIDTLVFVGVVTNQCVETSVRVAADLGYYTIVVEDGCAAIQEEPHQASIKALTDVYAKVKSTREVLEQLVHG